MAVHLRHRASTAYWTLLRYHARPYTSAAQENKDGKKRPTNKDRGKRPTLDFGNTVEAFRSKSMTELLRHYFVFKSFTFNTLVDNSQKLVNMLQRVFGRRFFNWSMKKTLYGQFVAGEDLDSLDPVIERYRHSGVRSILDYAVEEDIGDKQEELKNKLSARTYSYVSDNKCDQNKEHFLSCIEMAAKVAKGDNAFAAIKLTGLGRPELLECLSKMIVEIEDIYLRLANSEDILEAHVTLESFQRGLAGMGVELTPSKSERLFQEMDAKKRGKLSLSGWSDHFKPGRAMHGLFQSQKPKGYNLTAPDEQELDNMVKRAYELAQCAEEKGVCLMVDAEQTYFQPAIRHLAVNVLMPAYNKSRPVVYNTIQCYLKDAEKTLRMDLQKLSGTAGFRYGVKLVRGAYMEQERKLAKEKGYEDPIWPRKEDTDTCYHHLLELLLKQVEPGRLHIMVATHNEKTVQYAVDKMGQFGVDESQGTVVFGQLLGMCDHVTFTLGQAGYHAYKYMPYGPVRDVVPYLLRRVNENRGILDGAKRDRELVGREIRRRLFKRKE